MEQTTNHSDSNSDDGYGVWSNYHCVTKQPDSFSISGENNKRLWAALSNEDSIACVVSDTETLFNSMKARTRSKITNVCKSF